MGNYAHKFYLLAYENKICWIVNSKVNTNVALKNGIRNNRKEVRQTSGLGQWMGKKLAI
jgi:hypothetical protein